MINLHTVLRTNNDIAPLVLRLVAGIIFIAYGAQKLFGAFGGYGLEGTGQWMESIGLAPGYWMAFLAGSAEFFGGIALVIGLLVRPAALALVGTMVVAIVTVHLENGLFMANNGYAFGLTLLAMSAALVFTGAGNFNLDNTVADKIAGNAQTYTQPAHNS